MGLKETLNMDIELPSLDVLFARPLDMVTATRNLSVMLKAGLTVTDSLDILVEESGGRTNRVLKKVNKRVQQGQSLSSAIKPHGGFFSPIFITAVEVGESSGTLAENMKRVADQMEKNMDLRKNIKSALLYPGIVVFTTALLGFGMATFILPQLATVFTSLRVELPWNTQLLMYIAGLFADYGIWITIGFFALVGLMVLIFKLEILKPIIDRVILRIPGVGGFVHDINRARFCRSIGTLLESGVPIQEALGIVAKSLPNKVYQDAVKKMVASIETGQSFSEIIEYYPRLFPKMIERIMAVGEQTGGLGEVSLFLARFYEGKVESQSKNFATILEPFLLIVIGIAVAFLASSIFTPIYSLLGSLGV
jgi:type IV pilus assembly protein PilC